MGELYLYPGYWIAERCVFAEFIENVLDLDIEVRIGV